MSFKRIYSAGWLGYELGYLENRSIFSNREAYVARLCSSGFFSSKGTIYKTNTFFDSKIGEYDSKHWYDKEGNIVADVSDHQIRFVKGKFADKFIKLLF